MNADELKKTYSKFTDAQLLKLYTHERHELVEGALPVLEVVINERGLQQQQEEMTKVTDNLDPATIQRYFDLLSDQACPYCGSKREKLQAILVSKTMSFIIFTSYTRDLYIGCSNCLKSKSANGSITSGLLGWWGIPWGPIRSIQSLAQNALMNKRLKNEDDEILLSYVLDNVHLIELNKNDPDELARLIRTSG